MARFGGLCSYNRAVSIIREGMRMVEDRDGYREQTEEDLQNVPPMSTMQKAILAIAGIGVACAVVYIVLVTVGII